MRVVAAVCLSRHLAMLVKQVGLVSLLWGVAFVAEGHEGESWLKGHTAHAKVSKVEGYVIDKDASLTVMGKELRGKFSLPVVVEHLLIEEEYYIFDGVIEDSLYEDVGESGCAGPARLVIAGDATFTSGGQSIILRHFPLAELPEYYDGDGEHKGLRLKIYYSYRKHGEKQSIEKVAWTEC